MSWLDTSAGSGRGVSRRSRAGLQALPERKDQRSPPGPAWTWPVVVPQPAWSSAVAAQPSALASAAGTGTQVPPACALRPVSVTLPWVWTRAWR